MDFALSEEQQELASTVRALLSKRGDARVERYDDALWQTLCEQIGVAAIAELDFGWRHALSLLWQSGSVPAR